jgi:hypothetical protein
VANLQLFLAGEPALEGQLKLRRSLFSVISLCTASALVTALGLVVVFASVTVLLTVAHTLTNPHADVVSASTEVEASSINDETNSAINTSNAIIFDGVISDDHCGPKHDMGSGKSPSECAQACVRDGGFWVIINGDKKYKLAGRDDLYILAGEKVTVTGSLTGDTIKVNTITSEK